MWFHIDSSFLALLHPPPQRPFADPEPPAHLRAVAPVERNSDLPVALGPGDGRHIGPLPGVVPTQALFHGAGHVGGIPGRQTTAAGRVYNLPVQGG